MSPSANGAAGSGRSLASGLQARGAPAQSAAPGLGRGQSWSAGVIRDGAVGVPGFRRGSHLVEESEGLAFPLVLFHLENP